MKNLFFLEPGKVLDGLRKVLNGLGKVSDGLGKVLDGHRKVLEGLGKASDGLRKHLCFNITEKKTNYNTRLIQQDFRLYKEIWLKLCFPMRIA